MFNWVDDDDDFPTVECIDDDNRTGAPVNVENAWVVLVHIIVAQKRRRILAKLFMVTWILARRCLRCKVRRTYKAIVSASLDFVKHVGHVGPAQAHMWSQCNTSLEVLHAYLVQVHVSYRSHVACRMYRYKCTSRVSPAGSRQHTLYQYSICSSIVQHSTSTCSTHLFRVYCRFWILQYQVQWEYLLLAPRNASLLAQYKTPSTSPFTMNQVGTCTVLCIRSSNRNTGVLWLRCTVSHL